MRASRWTLCFSVVLAGLGASRAAAAPGRGSGGYLDARATAWLARGSCALSCHTTFPFLVTRPLLATSAGDLAVAREVRGRIEARVTGWETGEPWYASIARKARANEAVMNAVALTLNDANAQSAALGAVSRRALEIMWAVQRTTDGSWDWMDGFGLKPWESADSPYWGAVQVALAVGRAPGGYLAECERSATIRPRLDRLKRFLMTAYHAGSVSKYHQAFLLQASAKMSGLLTAAEAGTVADALIAAQQADGGWSLATLGGWTLESGHESSAYATGVVTAALGSSARRAARTAADKGKAWLRGHQAADGSWPDHSMNSPDSAFNNQLMTDAATAYAAAALATGGR